MCNTFTALSRLSVVGCVYVITFKTLLGHGQDFSDLSLFINIREIQIIFPIGMEEFQQLMDCEGKQKGTLLEASVRVQQFCNMVESETGSPVNVNLSKTETQVPLPPIKRGCN